MKRYRFIILLMAVLLVSGCMGRLVENPTRDDASLVFGFIDLGEGSTKGMLKGMEIVSLDEDTPGTFYTSTIHYGLFFHDDMPPGKYMVSNFRGSMFAAELLLGLQFKYQMPHYSKNPMKFELKEPGIYYLGTWKFRKVDDGFTLEPAEAPDKRQLLEWLMEEGKGTVWETRIADVLKRMK